MKKMMGDCGPKSDKAVMVDAMNMKPAKPMKKPMKGVKDAKYPKEYM
jgi:hypothetical protein